MAAKPRHKVTGEHIFDGIVLIGRHDREYLPKLKEFDLQDCTVIASYPKTGTTWVQEVVWQIQRDVSVSDNATQGLNIDQRFLFMELNSSAMQDPSQYTGYFKTHLPADFYTNQLNSSRPPKVVIVTRNPKDTLASYYNFYRMNKGFNCFEGNFNEFFELHREKHMVYGDFFDWCKSWWQYQHRSTVHTVQYEGLHKDLSGEIRKLASFLGKELDDARVVEIASQCSFGAMKSNKHTNYSWSAGMDQSITPFMRKGQIGDWKNYFTEEQSGYVTEQYERILKPIGLTFDFD